MRIAVNAWRLQGKLTGVGRYVLSILRQWTRDAVPAGVSIDVHVPAPLNYELPPNLAQVVHPSRARLLIWENSRLGPTVRADALFCPSYVRPLVCRAETVVTLHDATSAIHPDVFGRGQRWLYNPLYGWSARHATRIVTDTEASKADIVRYWRADAARITPIALAPADYFCPEPSPERRHETRRRFSPEGDPFFVFVGSVSGRRNVPLLVEAFALVHRVLPRHRLVLVTPTRDAVREEIRRLGLDEFVVSTGYVAHEALQPIYAAAEALVIPAIYETTSLPAIEAQACATPVVCIDTAGMREVTGTASCRFARLDVRLLADALERIALEPGLRDRLAAGGLANASQFTWKRTATETLTVLLEAAASRHRV